MRLHQAFQFRVDEAAACECAEARDSQDCRVYRARCGHRTTTPRPHELPRTTPSTECGRRGRSSLRSPEAPHRPRTWLRYDSCGTPRGSSPGLFLASPLSLSSCSKRNLTITSKCMGNKQGTWFHWVDTDSARGRAVTEP